MLAQKKPDDGALVSPVVCQQTWPPAVKLVYLSSFGIIAIAANFVAASICR